MKGRTHIAAAGRLLPRARTFSDVEAGEAFWCENSIGLVELAVNGGSAAEALGIRVGDAVTASAG
jgi:S-adenosylmethionine hydrolase